MESLIDETPHNLTMSKLNPLQTSSGMAQKGASTHRVKAEFDPPSLLSSELMKESHRISVNFDDSPTLAERPLYWRALENEGVPEE